jgi:oxygen-independent coproporphyrinogen-3 oxidase
MPLTAHERAVLEKWSGLELPRHTSYPAMPAWTVDTERANDTMESVLQGLDAGHSPMAPQSRHKVELYLHIPFCHSLCLYCGCNRQTLRTSERGEGLLSQTLEALHREIHALAQVPDLEVAHVHFGGGTPNYLSGAEWARLASSIRRTLGAHAQPDWSVEIDARHLKLSFLSALKDCGVRTASLGVQDLDPEVQKIIGRKQSAEQVAQAVAALRSHDVSFLNFDLIYGLPGQTPSTWENTLQRSLELRPSRFSIFRLALMPSRFPWQQALVRCDAVVPSDLQTAELFLRAKEVLEDAGYLHIGLDHFALPSDPLAQAMAQGQLGRSFQGYVENHRIQTIGLGPSSLSFFRGVYGQRVRSVQEWLASHNGNNQGSDEALRKGWRASYVLSARDAARFRIIQDIYGKGIVPRSVLDAEPPGGPLSLGGSVLAMHLQDGVLQKNENGDLLLTPRLGRLLSRLIASHFDDHHNRRKPCTEREPRLRHSLAF